MFGNPLLAGAMLAALSILPVTAQDMPAALHGENGSITISDAYARSVGAMARSGAVFFVIENAAAAPDRLVGVRSDAAARVELHTHMEADGGVMRMVEVEEGFAVPASGTHRLQRGGDHVMFMGLTNGWTDGETVPLTLVFENAGEITIEVPVDLSRAEEAMAPPAHGGHGNH